MTGSVKIATGFIKSLLTVGCEILGTIWKRAWFGSFQSLFYFLCWITLH